jgi:hypothetical protein
MKFFMHPSRLNSLLTIAGIFLSFALPTVVVGLHAADDIKTQVVFPAEYRHWVHVKSALIGRESPLYEAEGGFHHIYANAQALAGLESGSFSDGSIFVYDLLSLSEKEGRSSESSRRRVDVMVKDSKRYADSGGWGFGRFVADDRNHEVLTPERRTQCFQCHSSQKEHGLIFSRFRP